MDAQKSGFVQKSCAVDKQACVFGSDEFNKHSVPDNFVINGLNLEPVWFAGIKVCDTKL